MNENELSKLIAGCKSNKRSAQALLYKYFHDYGLSICLRYSASREEAREILDDGFMRVFTKIKDYPDNIHFKSWFRRILINISIDYYRKNQRQIELTVMEDASDQTVEPAYYEQLSYDQLIYFVEELSPTYRMVFSLYAIEGFSHEEISAALGIAESSSRSNLTRAKIRLQEKIMDHLKTVNI